MYMYIFSLQTQGSDDTDKCHAVAMSGLHKKRHCDNCNVRYVQKHLAACVVY